MKQLSFINKIIFILNVILAFSTVVGYLLPYFAPKIFPLLAVFTLMLPTLLIINLIMIVFWAIQRKRQVFLSLAIVFIGYTFFAKFYKLWGTNKAESADDITVLSYNVRLFNLFEWIPNTNVPENIKKFVEEKNPDIICFQEYSKSAKYEFTDYKFKHVVVKGKNIKTGQAIFSKFRIINEGEITLPNSDNNIIYADIMKNKDTVRIYSIHLESVNISKQINQKINESKSKMIFKRLSETFKEQQLQAELIKSHMDDFKGKKIICGDMNNTAFSYTYRMVKGNLQDAFQEAGQGFGKTYNYAYYPARIDYILVDNIFEIKQFETFQDFNNSDHYPIIARMAIKK